MQLERGLKIDRKRNGRNVGNFKRILSIVLVFVVSLSLTGAAVAVVANPTGTATPPCMENGDCSLNEFCLFPEGKCSGPGVCTPKPDVCPMHCASPPLCGCDMRAYCNPCIAYSKGVSILSTAGCEQ